MRPPSCRTSRLLTCRSAGVLDGMQVGDTAFACDLSRYGAGVGQVHGLFTLTSFQDDGLDRLGAGGAWSDAGRVADVGLTGSIVVPAVPPMARPPPVVPLAVAEMLQVGVAGRNSGAGGGSSSSRGDGGSDYAISPAERANYGALFRRYDNGDGLIPVAEAAQVPPELLPKVLLCFALVTVLCAA
jgi:hypothetical protein